jgi:Fe-S cluster biogenesis protein NfuA
MSDQDTTTLDATDEIGASSDDPGADGGGGEIDLALLNETLEYIRPALQADGGDLILLGVEEGKVTCPLSTMTLTAGIERILKDRVPGVTEIVAI